MLKHVVSAITAALLVVGVASAPAGAATIELNFDDGEFGSTDTASFEDGAYKFVLTFDNVLGPFIVEVTDILTTQEDLEFFDFGDEQIGNRLGDFASHVCVPIADGIGTCVVFEVSLVDFDEGDAGDGFYELQIIWSALTDDEFSNEPGDRIRILHDSGLVPGPAFDSDITQLGTYFGGEADPWIFGRDNNFQAFVVTQAPAVPEPATLLLLGTGLAGLAYRRKRRRADR